MIIVLDSSLLPVGYFKWGGRQLIQVRLFFFEENFASAAFPFLKRFISQFLELLMNGFIEFLDCEELLIAQSCSDPGGHESDSGLYVVFVLLIGNF